jgi:hypothetical protein
MPAVLLLWNSKIKLKTPDVSLSVLDHISITGSDSIFFLNIIHLFLFKITPPRSLCGGFSSSLKVTVHRPVQNFE